VSTKAAAAAAASAAGSDAVLTMCERCQSAEDLENDPDNPIVPCAFDGCSLGLHRFCFSRAVHPAAPQLSEIKRGTVHNFCTNHVEAAVAAKTKEAVASADVQDMTQIMDTMPQPTSLGALRAEGDPHFRPDDDGGNHDFSEQRRLPAAHWKEALEWNSKALGVEVKQSTIAGAGTGLFAARNFQKDALIGWVYGVIVTRADHELMKSGYWRLDSVLGSCNYAEEDFTAPPFAGVGRVLECPAAVSPRLKAAQRATQAHQALLSPPLTPSAPAMLLVSQQCPLMHAIHRATLETAAKANLRLDPDLESNKENANGWEFETFPLYATRDINAGEELCFSYKWTPEQWDALEAQRVVYAKKLEGARRWVRFPTEHLYAWCSDYPQFSKLQFGGPLSRTDRKGLLQWAIDWSGELNVRHKQADEVPTSFKHAALVMRQKAEGKKTSAADPAWEQDAVGDVSGVEWEDVADACRPHLTAATAAHWPLKIQFPPPEAPDVGMLSVPPALARYSEAGLNTSQGRLSKNSSQACAANVVVCVAIRRLIWKLCPRSGYNDVLEANNFSCGFVRMPANLKTAVHKAKWDEALVVASCIAHAFTRAVVCNS
jgi:hypothetical protein